MKDIRTLLRDADPLRHEAGLEPAALAELRRTVLAAAPRSDRRTTSWTGQLVLAACLSVMALAGVIAARRVPAASEAPPLPSVMQPASAQRTQLQFATPGGTRIVWTIDPAFQLREKR